jgi:hypothetical protein
MRRADAYADAYFSWLNGTAPGVDHRNARDALLAEVRKLARQESMVGRIMGIHQSTRKLAKGRKK